MSSVFPAPVREPFRYLKTTLAGVQNKLVESPPDPVEVAQTIQAESIKKQSEIKTAWREEWLRRQKERVMASIQEMSEDGVKQLEHELVEDLQRKQSHPSVIKRLQSHGWFHPIVRHLMIEFYARAVMGEAWDKPTPEDLLDIASEMRS